MAGVPRRSSIVFPNEPDSERGLFLHFLEESGANAVLLDAFRALYETPEKPDSPLDWLRNYFRELAPPRKEGILETKRMLRQQLLNLQASIFEMQEDVERKEDFIRIFEGSAACEDPYVDTSPLPERAEYFLPKNTKLRAETRWRLQPDPFARISCSAEEVIKSKAEAVSAPLPSAKTETESVLGEDYYDDAFEFLAPSMTAEEEEEPSEVDEATRDEEWQKAYDVYKETSQLPHPKKTRRRLRMAVRNVLDKIKRPVPKSRERSSISVPSQVMSEEQPLPEVESEVRKASELPPHPDAIPPNFWTPGFNLNTNPSDHDSSDESDAMLDEDNDEAGRTKSGLYYRASRGNSRYVLRPHREEIIYENEWELWRGMEALLNEQDDPTREHKTSKVVHGPEFESHTVAGEVIVPSTNSAQVGSSARDLQEDQARSFLINPVVNM